MFHNAGTPVYWFPSVDLEIYPQQERGLVTRVTECSINGMGC